MVEYHPFKNTQSRLQFGKKGQPVIFVGYALIAVRIWKGDIEVADIEKKENMDASEIHPRKINETELLITQFAITEGAGELSGREHAFREHTPYGAEVSVENFLKTNRKSLNRQNQKMAFKPEKIFGRYKVTSILVTTLNLEFDFTWRKRIHSPFHCNTLI